MLKLCYKKNAKRTDEYYFDLQSQKVYKICLSTYYAKQNTRGIPFVFVSGGILAVLLEQVSQRVLLPKNGGLLLLFLVVGILVLLDKKVKKSFIEKYQYIEEHTLGIYMEKAEVLKLYTLGKWNRRAFGFIVLIGLFIFLIGMILIIQTEREMLSLERNRYIQVCRENEYAVLYYDNEEEKIIRYKTGKFCGQT